jgi:DNA invertase Pin-like site-specific DNA recombinase
MSRNKSRWVVVFLIFIITLINYIDRSSVAYITEVLKKDFGLNATKIGAVNSICMSKFFSIQQAALFLGVSTQTLRRWEQKKAPSHRTKGGQRRYDVSQLTPSSSLNQINERPTIAYARVSSHDQKEDLQRQVQMLEIYCAARGTLAKI